MRLEMAFVYNIFQFNPVCSLIFNYLSRLMVDSLTNRRFIQSPSRLESPFQMLSTGSLPEKKERIFSPAKNFHLHPKVPFLDGPPQRRPTWGNGRGKGASGQSTVGRLRSSKEPNASERSRGKKSAGEHIGLAQRWELAKHKIFFTVLK